MPAARAARHALGGLSCAESVHHVYSIKMQILSNRIKREVAFYFRVYRHTENPFPLFFATLIVDANLALLLWGRLDSNDSTEILL